MVLAPHERHLGFECDDAAPNAAFLPCAGGRRDPSDDPPARSVLDYRFSIYQDPSVKRAGDKPLPAASLHLVLALLEGETHGYALMRRVAELSDGAVRMGPGTLYGTLNRLVQDGLIEETTDAVEREESERRRYYRLSASGRAIAVAELDRSEE